MTHLPFLHNITAGVRTCTDSVLDAVFPKRCIGCRTFDTWLCERCHSTLPLLTEQKCPFCTQVTTPQGQACLACSADPHCALTGVFVASSYDNDLLRQAIHHYKYRFIDELDTQLALLLAQALLNTHLPAPDLLIPVPLHPRRMRWRGFNQATRLAHALDLTIPVHDDLLRRVRHTTSQVKVRSRRRRQQNLRNAFTVTNSALVQDKNILLIDDVTTTGTTLNECARALTAAGAASVSGLVLARE